ncbi:MFS transporter [Lihuaxuella thermophila]|uniref:Transmembrane secretion effector n=1 Tax=Lihuaxuella thermophila TaxID=1173111 RepID=A0A1H8IYF5_9BACL|nr:MFS transporter [Lihuaxuella thermophila]SEN73542.1 Transmembrane secretion effector [Lihuaxuella thermophila]
MRQLAYTVFIEYQVLPEQWEKFLSQVPVIRETTRSSAGILSHSFLTGSEQPFLVVEILQVADWNDYLRIRELREHGGCCEWESLIKGGRSGIRIWAFEPIVQQSSPT